MKWRTVNGYVDTNTGSGWGRMLVKESKRTERVETWLRLCRKAARQKGAPLSWVLGVMYAESGGIPTALSPAGAIGLMQIMWKYHKCAPSKAELYEPRYNVPCGAGLLGQSHRLGYDLPRAASRYNAGAVAGGAPHPSQKSPWGMRENKGYISRVVAANNFFRARYGAGGATHAWGGALIAVLSATTVVALEKARRRR